MLDMTDRPALTSSLTDQQAKSLFANEGKVPHTGAVPAVQFLSSVPALSLALLTYAIQFGPEVGKHMISVLGADGVITVSKKLITNIKSGSVQLNHDLQKAIWTSYLKAMIHICNASWEDATFLANNNSLLTPSQEQLDTLLGLKQGFEAQLADIKRFTPPPLPHSLLNAETILDTTDVSKAKAYFQDTRHQIIKDILDGISHPLPDIFTRRVQLDLFPEMAEFFADQIKTQDPVYRILTTQYLANNYKLTQQLITDLEILARQSQTTAQHIERMASTVERLTWPDELLQIDQGFLDRQEKLADPASFYRGYTTWAAVAAGCAFPRAVTMNRTRIPYPQFKGAIEKTCAQQGTHCVIVTGVSGNGKTVLLYQLGADLSKARMDGTNKYAICYLIDSMDLPKVSQLYTMWLKAGRPIFLLADVYKIKEFVYLLHRWAAALGPLGAHVIFICAIRENEYVSHNVNARLEGVFTSFQEAHLDKLSDEEIDSLLALLKEHKELHSLAMFSATERKARLREANERELIVALLETTHGRGFEQLLVEEYHSLRREVQPFYALVSLLHSCGIECPRGLAEGILHSFPALARESLGTLAPRVIIVTPTTVRSRHRLIATEILKTQLLSKDRLQDAERICGLLATEADPSSPAHRQIVASVFEGLAFSHFDLGIQKRNTRRVARRSMVQNNDSRTAIWRLIETAAEELHSGVHNARAVELLKWSLIYFMIEEGMQDVQASDYLRYTLQVLELILKVDARDARARFRRASALFRKVRAFKNLAGQESDAIWNTIHDDVDTAYLRKERLGNNLADFLLLYALIEENQGNPERAAALFEEALLADPFHEYANMEYNKFWQRCSKKDEQLIGIYRAAFRIAPRNSHTHLRLVDELRKRRQFELALAETSELIELLPSNPHCWAEHASVLGDMGRAPEAIAAMGKALDLHPEATFKRVQWLYNVGFWYEQIGSTSNAYQYYLDSQKINDTLEFRFPWTYIALSRVSLTKGVAPQVVDALILQADEAIEKGLKVSQHTESLIAARKELDKLKSTKPN